MVAITSISPVTLPQFTSETTKADNAITGDLGGRTIRQAKPNKSLLERITSTIKHNLPGRSMLDQKLTTNGRPNQESRFALSMIMDRATHFLARTRLGKVRDSVAKHGGEITFKFAQTKGTLLNQIMKHKDTSGGVCESVSAHWLSAKAKGESLFDNLYAGGEKG